jgi:spermidine synthase
MGWLFLTGFLSTLAQVVALREASVAFFGVELIYLLAIGIWLFWTGTGAACDAGRDAAPARGAVVALVLALAVLLPADVALFRASRILAGATPGAYVAFPRQVGLLAAALLPLGVLLGLLFQWTARRAMAGGRSLAAAYGVESLGALTGGLVTLAWTVAGLPTLGLALAGSVLAATCSLAAWSRLGAGARSTAALVLVLALGAASRTGPLDAAMTRWNHPLLLAAEDSPYGRITLTGTPGEVAVFENDALSFDSASAHAEVLAHLAALSHPSPARVLALGGGPEGVARELARHGPSRLDLVEVNATLVSLTRRWAPEALPGAGPPVTLFIEDPRQFLRREGAAYDILVVSAPDPDSGQANRFYTREFFRACARRLAPGGLLALRLHTAETVWTPAQALRVSSVHAALAAVFPRVLVLPGAASVVLASASPLPDTAGPLVSRYHERGLDLRLAVPGYLEYVFSNDRRTEVAALLGRTPAPVNTDAHPACYRYALVIWLGRFWPGLATMDPHAGWLQRAGRGSTWLALGALAALVWFARHHPRGRPVALVALLALAGMLLESVVLLHYQVTQGIVFRDIGLLVATFMAGLAAGAAMANARGSTHGADRRDGLLIVVVLVLTAALAAALIAMGAATTLWRAATLMAVTGAGVGAAFAWASRAYPGHQRAAIAPLYAADLIGGAVGAVLGGLVLVPLAGLAVTGAVAAGCALSAASLLWSRERA